MVRERLSESLVAEDSDIDEEYLSEISNINENELEPEIIPSVVKRAPLEWTGIRAALEEEEEADDDNDDELLDLYIYRIAIAKDFGNYELARKLGEISWRECIDKNKYLYAIVIAKMAGLEKLAKKAEELAYEYYYSKLMRLKKFSREAGKVAYVCSLRCGDYSEAKEIAKSFELGEDKVNLAETLEKVEEALEKENWKYLGKFELPNRKEIPIILYKPKSQSSR